MKLQKFGKLMRVKFGSIGGELLQKLHDFYINDKETFENTFGYFEEELGNKGCFLFEATEKDESFIMFGVKYIDKKEKTILIKGSVIARGESCEWKVGDKLTPNPDIVNQFRLLDSAGLITTISDFNMVTNEIEGENEETV